LGRRHRHEKIPIPATLRRYYPLSLLNFAALGIDACRMPLNKVWCKRRTKSGWLEGAQGMNGA